MKPESSTTLRQPDLSPDPAVTHIRSITPVPSEKIAASPAGTIASRPGRKIQIVELGVFLLLVVPSLSTSFMITTQSSMNFAVGAVFSILNDFGLVGLVFYFVWRNREPLRHIGWTAGGRAREVGWGVLLFLPITYCANYLESALSTAGLSAPTKLPGFLAASGPVNIALAVVLVIVVAIAEETLFRGYLIRRFNALVRRPWLAVLLSSAVFALGHGYEGAAGVISVYFLGTALAVVYLWRRSLVAPMIIHFLIDFNSIVLAALAAGGS